VSKRKPIELTAVIEKHGRWYMGYISEVPGVNVQERTLKATRESLRSALAELAELHPRQIRDRSRRVERITVTL
jgi:hypothetical protein